MASGLTSKEDSDRLIRDLMKKTKDLEKQISVMKQAQADGSNALKEALADRAAMADQLGQIQGERDSLVCPSEAWWMHFSDVQHMAIFHAGHEVSSSQVQAHKAERQGNSSEGDHSGIRICLTERANTIQRA